MNHPASYFIISPGPRPPYHLVAEHLWGGADFDSDGNSETPTDTNWTELTVQLRPDGLERVDIDSVFEDPLVLKIASGSPALAKSVAEFLASSTGGKLDTNWKGSGNL